MSRKINILVWTDRDIYRKNEEIKASVKIVNIDKEPLKLEFNSTQHYDFIVLKKKREVYRWSADKAFSMMINSMIIEPSEEKVFTERINPRLPSGTYRLIGVITCKQSYRSYTTFKVE